MVQLILGYQKHHFRQENIIPGPPQQALLLPALFTGSLGLFYMACRQILKAGSIAVDEVYQDQKDPIQISRKGSLFACAKAIIFSLTKNSKKLQPSLAISDHQDYIKKLEQERFESDIREAHEVLAHMGERLQTLKPNQSVREAQEK